MLGELIVQGIGAVVGIAVLAFVVAVVVSYPLSRTSYYNPTYKDHWDRLTLEGFIDALSVTFWIIVLATAISAALGGVVEVIQWVV